MAASLVAAAAWVRGARVVVGGESWFGLGFELGFGVGQCRGGCRSCFCDVGGCVGWCWWWCCCCWCDCLGAGLGLGSGFWLGSGSRLRRTSVWRCKGAGAGGGAFPVCCRGAWVACVEDGEPPVAWRAAAALALAVALWMRSENEVEDEEEVVVLGDARCAVMRAVAGLTAAGSGAATAGRMEGMSSGCRLGMGGSGGPAVTWRPGWQIWSAAVAERGAGLRSLPSGLGWAWVLQCVRLCGLASAGGNSSARCRGLDSGGGGVGAGIPGVCAGGLCGPLGGMGVPWGVGLLAVGVCGWPDVGGGERCPAAGSVAGVCCGLGGWGRPVSWGPGLRATVGVCGLPGVSRGGRGRGGYCAGGCVVSLCVSACSGVLVWSVVGRAVWRRGLLSSAAAARISQMSMRILCTSWLVVGRGYASFGLRPRRRRILCMAWECCGLGGGSFRVSGPASIC